MDLPEEAPAKWLKKGNGVINMGRDNGDMKQRVGMVVGWILLIMLLGSGCATPIRYGLENVYKPKPDSKRQALKVAVAPFQDIRPDWEKAQTNVQASVVPPSQVISQDRFFEGGNVAVGVSQALVLHFNHVQLFTATVLTNSSVSIPSADAIREVHELGYDALLTGKLVHFYGVGYSTGLDKFALIVARVPILGLAFMPFIMIQDNTNQGSVELADLQLMDTSSGNVIWSGALAKQMEYRFYDTLPARAANETLREVVNEMVVQVEAVEFKDLSVCKSSEVLDGNQQSITSQAPVELTNSVSLQHADGRRP